MQTTEFLNLIDEYDELPLVFRFGNDQVVQGGYHVTEIKNATYETIDCGNSLHTWKEVIIQLWVPEEAEVTDPFMPSTKFRKIWDVVDSRLDLFRDGVVKIEFGDAYNLTSHYDVGSIQMVGGQIVVDMVPPRTMCKPREILVPLNPVLEAVPAAAGSCCSPVAEPARVETVIPLAVAKATNGCC